MNRKGLTILEVLASVIILIVVILTATYIFQQSSLFSRDNQKVEQSLLITRTVIEEIKQKMRSQNTTEIEGFIDQQIDLKHLKDNDPPSTVPITLFYPSTTDPQYKIEIRSIVLDNNVVRSPSGIDINLNDYFRLIQLTTTDLLRNKSIQLESYVDRE